MIIPFLLTNAMRAYAHTPDRAMWVWNGDGLVRDAAKRSSFFEFLAAPKGDPSAKISVIFLSRVGIEDPTSNTAIGNFIAEAHHRKIRVDYLCGDAAYVLPARKQEGLSQLEFALGYNIRAPRDRRFDGFQYDVEPYLLPGWPTAELRKDYLDFLSEAAAKITAEKQRLKLGCAIPRWFDAPDLNDLYKEVLARVDYVAVMDYVSRSEQFVHDGANTVEYATRVGKEAWLGAETSKLSDEPTATFFDKGNAAMEDAFVAAFRAFGKDAGFAGVAIEYYETYQALKP